MPIPVLPQQEFLGWYYDAALTQPVGAADTVNGPLTLYASYSQPAPGSDYTITFESNGGSTVSPLVRTVNSRLSGLPAPYLAEKTFQGWFYDAALTRPVAEADTITGDLTLYAGYSTPTPLQELESPRTASAIQQQPDFTLNVISSESQLTAQQVKELIVAENLSSPRETDVITVSGGNGLYTIAGANGGFEPGATYKLTLNYDALSFAGCAATVREYALTFAKSETLGLRLDNDVICLPRGDVSGLTRNGAPVVDLDMPLAQVGVAGSGFANVTGKFTNNSGQPLAKGEAVAIYEGLSPADRDLSTENEGAVAYVIVTSVEGDTVNYRSANAREVIFLPDVLPLANSADLDGDSTNHAVTVLQSNLVYTDDQYQQLKLDSQTLVEPGDFLVFYDGPFSVNADVTGFALIITVAQDNKGTLDPADDVTLLTYTDVTREEMLASVDIYNQETIPITADDVDVDALEGSVERQAIESGFAEGAADYLAGLAMATEGFTTLAEDYDLTGLEDYNLTGLEIGEVSEVPPMLVGGGTPGGGTTSPVEVEISKVKANILPNGLKHIGTNGSIKGVRLTLELGVLITIHVTEQADLEIEITALFEQEVGLAKTIDGGAVWSDTLIPYIEEYEATVVLDVYDYTGISLEAVLSSKSVKPGTGAGVPAEYQELVDLADQITALMDAKDKYLGDGSATIAQSLVEQYQRMLENETDWATLYEASLLDFSGSVDPFHLLAYNINVKFIITANVNISIGCSFVYQNAKSYVYTVRVFDCTVDSNTVDINPATYTFRFYVMGTIGLRAGIRASISIGLVSTKLDSVGFTAETGAYIRLWGYFYYSYTWVDGQGGSSSSAGALYLELGIYLEVKFVAQALNSTFSYNPTLYANEWPLLTAGARENVQSFAYGDNNRPDITLKRMIRTLSVPVQVFNMTYLDLKTGEVMNKCYQGTDFTVLMTNPAFSYNYANNTITVDPGSSEELSGEMILTWNASPLAFTSIPIRQRVNLSWNNYNDGYSIVFDSNGGSMVEMIVAPKNTAISVPQPPLKQGYVFDGWYSNRALTTPYTIPAKMPALDSLVFAKWAPADNTPYKVDTYLQELNLTYTLEDSSAHTGTTDSTVTPQPTAYEGYVAPAASPLTILPDGSANVQYYYTRAYYNATFSYGQAGGAAIVSSFRYGATVLAPTLYAPGYTFTGWDTTPVETMPARDLTYVAQWTPAEDTPYRIEHYLQNTVGDGYTLVDLTKASGRTGASIPLAGLVKDMGAGISFERGAVNGISVVNATIAANGGLVIKLYYQRASHTLSFAYGTGSEETSVALPQAVTYRVGATIQEPNPIVKQGYVFSGWHTDAAMTPAAQFGYGNLTMGNADMTLYVTLAINSVEGWSRVYYVGLEGAEHTNPAVYQTGTAVPLADPSARSAYQFVGWFSDEARTVQVSEIAASASGDVVLYAQWQAIAYDITYYNIDGLTNTNPATYTIEDAVTLAPVTKPGYQFAGWFTNEALTTAAATPAISGGSTGPVSFYAQWTPNTYQAAFFGNGGSGEMAAQTFTYDTAADLSANSFSRSGYTFAGWAGSPDGVVLYTNGMEVQNLTVMQNGVYNLYAQWTPISYDITYNLNGGVNNETNPLTYNIETATIALAAPTNANDDLTFGGWYEKADFSGDKVTNIPIGSTGTKTYYAKWLDGGRISLAANGNTFTITRSGGTDGAVTVSYRTQSGSAIAGTHFTGISNSVTFNDGESGSKQVTVSEKAVTSIYNGKPATAYSNADRSYSFAISAIDGAKLAASESGVRTRTMGKDNNYVVSADYYGRETKLERPNTEFPATANERENIYIGKRSVYMGKNGFVGDGANDKGKSTKVSWATPDPEDYGDMASDSQGKTYGYQLQNFCATASLTDGRYPGIIGDYMAATATSYAYRYECRVYAQDDAWSYFWIGDHRPNNNDTTGDYAAGAGAMCISLSDTGWGDGLWSIGIDLFDEYTTSLAFPGIHMETASSKPSESGKNIVKSPYAYSGFHSTCDNTYVYLAADKAVWACFGASGNNKDRWYVESFVDYINPKDESRPTVLGVATLPHNVIKGDQVTVAVVFNEIVNVTNASITLNCSLNESQWDGTQVFTYQGGSGTNVLYFSGPSNSALAANSTITVQSINLVNGAGISDLSGNVYQN